MDSHAEDVARLTALHAPMLAAKTSLTVPEAASLLHTMNGSLSCALAAFAIATAIAAPDKSSASRIIAAFAVAPDLVSLINSLASETDEPALRSGLREFAAHIADAERGEPKL